jgi:hypothetical protein
MKYLASKSLCISHIWLDVPTVIGWRKAIQVNLMSRCFLRLHQLLIVHKRFLEVDNLFHISENYSAYKFKVDALVELKRDSEGIALYNKSLEIKPACAP